MQVMHLLLSGHIEHKTASLLLYGLQTASLNLRTASFEPTRKESVVIDPNAVDATPLGENPWNREDFQNNEKGDEQDGGMEIQAQASPPEDFFRVRLSLTTSRGG